MMKTLKILLDKLADEFKPYADKEWAEEFNSTGIILCQKLT